MGDPKPDPKPRKTSKTTHTNRALAKWNTAATRITDLEAKLEAAKMAEQKARHDAESLLGRALPGRLEEGPQDEAPEPA